MNTPNFNTSWQCPAIDNGVEIMANDTIRPCCESTYEKPITEILNPDRFKELYELKDQHCTKCIEKEKNNVPSYRQHFLRLQKYANSNNTTNIQFLDIRNSNLCNSKCRTCGPHFSHLWDKEINKTNIIRHSNINEYFDLIINPDLIEIYFAGGEPLINDDHYRILERCIANGTSSNIKLRYNTNLSTLRYKNKDIMQLWDNFKKIHFDISIDAIGSVFNNLRSGSDWDTINANLDKLQTKRNDLNSTNLDISIHLTASNLNIWFIVETLTYLRDNNFKFEKNLAVDFVTWPPNLSLSAIPAKLVKKVTSILKNCATLGMPAEVIEYGITLLNSKYQDQFDSMLADQSRLDEIRKESMCQILSTVGVTR